LNFRPIIPAFFWILTTNYYSQDYSGIIHSGLITNAHLGSVKTYAGWAVIKLAFTHYNAKRHTLDERCYFEIELRMLSVSI